MTNEEKPRINLNELCCCHSCAGDFCCINSWTEQCKGVKKCIKFQPKEKLIKEWKDYEVAPSPNKTLIFKFESTNRFRDYDYRVMTLYEYLIQDKENIGWAEINAEIVDY